MGSLVAVSYDPDIQVPGNSKPREETPYRQYTAPLTCKTMHCLPQCHLASTDEKIPEIFILMGKSRIQSRNFRNGVVV